MSRASSFPFIFAAIVSACGPSPSTCVPGEQVTCACAGGTSGFQRCASDGTYGECACDGADASTPVDASVPVDAAGSPSDGGRADAAITLPDSGGSACTVPTGTGDEPPIGTSIGRTMRPFTLDRCDGTPYEFYGEAEGFCESTFTVLTLAAGWCAPCQMEASLLQTTIADVYADRGVRVVQVMLQNPDGTPSTPAFCQQWVDRYDLRFAELLDPAGTSWIYAPDNALPATVIVDSRGVIQYREYGTTANLSSLTAALDRLTSE